MGGGVKSGGNFTGSSAAKPGQATPNLFQPYAQNMPSEFFGTKPINDPTSILQAYMQNLPQFLAASRSSATPAPVAPAATTAKPQNPSLYDILSGKIQQ